MRDETMTSKERLMAAVHMERPDRVPICPMIDTAPAANLLGLKAWEVVAQGFEAQELPSATFPRKEALERPQ